MKARTALPASLIVRRAASSTAVILHEAMDHALFDP